MVCSPAGVAGQGELLPSVVGISTLDRENDTSWLESIKNGQLILDSKIGGLVIPRMAGTSSIDSPSGGMILYDTTANCIKMYQNNKWGCIQRHCLKIINAP